jgi:hypothetical protein
MTGGSKAFRNTPSEQGYECLSTEIAELKPIKGNQTENGTLPGELAG